MANVKISALPTWTGTAADSRWFVMDNSGLDTTYKFSGYTSPLKTSNGVNSFVNAYDDTTDTAGDYQSVVGGLDNTIQNTDPRESIFGGYSHTITNKSQGYGSVIVGGAQCIIGGPSDANASYGAGIYSSQDCENNGYFNAIIGGIRNKIYNGNSHGFLAGGDTNYITAGNYNSVVGGQNNIVSGPWSAVIAGKDNQNGHLYGFIGAGNGNTLTGAGNRGFISGGIQNNIHGGDANFIGGGAYNEIRDAQNNANIAGWGQYIYQTGVNSSTNAMIGSQYGYFRSSAGGQTNGTFEQLFMAGSNRCEIQGTAGSPAKRSFIIGGSGATITSTTGSFVLGGEDNTLTSNQSFIIASTNSDVNNASGGNAPARDGLIASLDSTINGGNRIIGLGLSGRTFGAGRTGFTAVENLYVYKQIDMLETTYDGSSSTIDIDITNSGLVELTATGGTYNIDIQPSTSNIGLELTLMIHYYSAATINFVSAGNTQWKWGNGAGAPVFSGNNNYNILVFRSWDGNDLYEQSRSMWMS